MHPLYLGNGILETLLFIGVISVYFYLPGRWLINKLHLPLDATESVVLPTTLGIILFTMAAYITSWVHIVPIMLLPIGAIAISSLRTMKRNHVTLPGPQDMIRIATITLLAVVFSLPMTRAGIWGSTIVADGADDPPHLAYIHELVAHFPPDNPGAAGVPLRGYHFFVDFLVATIHRLSGIAVESLYYHYMPLLVALVISFGVYTLVFQWTKNKGAGIWAVLLTLFGGSFGFILRLQGHASASMTSTFGIDQPATAILNSPFAFSLGLVVCALILMLHYSQKRNVVWLYLLALCVGITPIYKVYAGIALFAGFSFLTLWECTRRRYTVIPPYLVAVGIALATFGVFSGPGNYLIYLPLWAPHRMLTANLPWYGFEEKYYTYKTLGVVRGIVTIETYGLVLFLFGNLGSRFVGMIAHAIPWVKKRYTPSLFALTLTVMIAVSILVPLFFIQSVKVFEIIQLAWYYPFFCAIAAAPGFTYLISRIPKHIRWIGVGLLILLTIPSTWEIFTTYTLTPKTRSPLSAYAPYQFLRQRGTYDDTVVELPPAGQDTSVKNLRIWYEQATPTIPAFANKRSYFNTMQIYFPNLDIDGRAQFLHDVLALASPSGSRSTDTKNAATLTKTLHTERIKYVYSPYPVVVASLSANLQEVFGGGGAWIYEVTP